MTVVTVTAETVIEVIVTAETAIEVIVTVVIVVAIEVIVGIETGMKEKNEMRATLMADWTSEFEILLMEEILHQLIGSLSHYSRGFTHPRWCRISSINSITRHAIFIDGR